MNHRFIGALTTLKNGKRKYVIAMTCLGFLLSGCGGGGGSGGNNTPEPQPEPEPEAATWGQSNWDEADWQ